MAGIGDTCGVTSDQTREVLEQARTAADEQVAVLTRQLRDMIDASRDTNADDEHDPEGSTIAFERAQLTALLARARQRLADVVTALRRYDDGDYGICEVCGKPIAAERLAVRPSARTCVGCAS
jgi:RNA polymerase-binding transcription factor DksA